MPLNRGNLSLSEEDCLQPSGDDSDKLSHQSGSVLDLIPCDSSKMYPHQLEGFEFMWKNIAGSTDLKDLSNSEPNDVGGCIISHAPGTGKTCMTILFCTRISDSSPIPGLWLLLLRACFSLGKKSSRSGTRNGTPAFYSTT